jgi:hypothetical protein
MRNNKYLYLTLLAVLGFHQEAIAQAVTAAPKLVVNITIDQLRADYLETYAPLYCRDGFNRLLAQGKIYTNASYNFAPIDRASAIASLVTGTTPYYHGIIGTEWLERPSLQTVSCINKAEKRNTPANLQTSTLGDEMKLATDGVSLVYSFAPTADAAILSAGHAANGVAWANQSRWNNVEYYAPLPQWQGDYTRTFGVGTDVNRSVTDLAIKCIEQSSIGIDDAPDLLNIVYQQGATPRDTYINLDYDISRLITRLESRFGLNKVLVVLTGTGYAEERRGRENEEKFHIPTGKFNIVRTANLLNMYLGAIYGPTKYVETCYKNQLFLNRQLIERLNINLSELLKRSQDFLIQVEGVRNVYSSTQLMTSENSRLEKIRNGYCIDKCGDLIIEVAPGWKLVNEERHENSVQRASFFSFPIIFYGANMPKERVLTPVTVDRIAPTIAKAIRIRAPNACTSEPLF